MTQEKTVIGRLELVKFDELSKSDEEVIAKIDTGAHSGALHVVYEHLETDENGKEWLVYKPVNDQHKEIKTDKFSKVVVKSSNGIEEERHRVDTRITIAGKTYPISLTLRDRSEMTYEVIVGYEFLKGRFLVDVSQENI